MEIYKVVCSDGQVIHREPGCSVIRMVDGEDFISVNSLHYIAGASDLIETLEVIIYKKYIARIYYKEEK